LYVLSDRAVERRRKPPTLGSDPGLDSSLLLLFQGSTPH